MLVALLLASLVLHAHAQLTVLDSSWCRLQRRLALTFAEPPRRNCSRIAEDALVTMMTVRGAGQFGAQRDAVRCQLGVTTITLPNGQTNERVTWTGACIVTSKEEGDALEAAFRRDVFTGPYAGNLGPAKQYYTIATEYDPHWDPWHYEPTITFKLTYECCLVF